MADINRRTFLKGTAGTMAALVVASAYNLDALAQDGAAGSTGFQFLNEREAKAVDAVAEQYWPTTDDSPGGSDAGVVYYIDRALNGAYRAYQPVYRAGLAWLDEAANEQYGAAFAALAEDQQFAFLTDALAPPAPAATPAGTPEATAAPVAEEEIFESPRIAGGEGPHIKTLAEFLTLLRTHTMEGLFSDPVYGGNRDFAGWKAVGYGGAYYFHTEEQQQSFEPLNLPPQSIADL